LTRLPCRPLACVNEWAGGDRTHELTDLKSVYLTRFVAVCGDRFRLGTGPAKALPRCTVIGSDWS
jgi:hypothetical protein